jgi:outer membrane protein insertion porin family
MKLLYFIFFTILLLSKSFAVIIKDVNLIGNDRISKETIIVFGSIDLNKDYSNSDLNQLLKNLYNSNYFEDVKIKISSNTLNITVKEYPIIQNIFYNGIKAKKFEKIIIDNSNLKEKSAFNDYKLKLDINLIKNAFKQVGFFFINVDTSINKNDNNTVDLTFDIDLGEKAEISKIKFIGDKIFKDRKLRNIIVSEESKPWKFLSSKKFLNENRINLDVRLLKNFYIDKGYYDAQIKNSTSTYLDNNEFELSFVINAGKRYTFRNSKLILPTDFDPNHFKTINLILDELNGEFYSLSSINKIIDKIEKISLKKQYEFLDATFDETIVDKDKIDLNIELKESEKFYVEKINIFGNNITRENVIRNSLLLDEGDGFNKLLLEKSINKLRSRNFFASVVPNVTTGSTSQFKVLNIEVEEKPTGEISAGAGIGTSGTSIGFSVTENNYLGKGIRLETSINFAEDDLRGVIDIRNPNFMYSDRTLNTRLSSTKTDRLVEAGYKNSRTGGSIGTYYEQYEDFFFSPSLEIYVEKLKTDLNASTTLKKQEGNYFDIDFNYGLVLDKRNSNYRPSDGYVSEFQQKLPLVSENYSFYNSYEYIRYKEITDRSVGSFGFFIGAVNSIADKDVRVSERLYISQNRLRGFEKGRVGPKEKGDWVGGNYMSSANFKLALPKVFETFQNADLTLFVDFANVWGVDYSDSISDSNAIRSSTGITLDVFTPIGPLNFSFSQALLKASTDVTEFFRFNIGTTF